jgi:23S rRNA (uracil1939-C5)-methyltransferase
MQRGSEITVKITDYAFGGRGIARLETENGAFVVFVDNTFPGQTVKAKVETKRKSFAEAKLIEIVERSTYETNQDFQEISGGPYIHVPVEIQEKVKQDSTLQTFKKLSGIDASAVFDTFISSPEHYFYRNKMEYSFSCIEHDLETNEELDDAFALGFKRRGTWWKVESLNKPSGLFDEEWERKLKEIRIFLKNTGLLAWHPPKKTGFFRHIVVRKSFYTNQLLVNLVTSSNADNSFDAVAFGEFLKQLFKDRIAGFQHTENDNVADRAKIENGTTKLIFGKPVVEEKLGDLFFQISMESFFQTNPKCAQLLYNKALDYVFEREIEDEAYIMDLFCGTGTIGQLLSIRQPRTKIIGVDIVEEAIRDAKVNAKKNNLSNIVFFAADVGKFLKEHPEFIGKIDTLVLDPPRAGIAPKTLLKVIELGAKNIVYISCNPSTQARDANTLAEFGFELKKYALVDQFPHTGHIESIAKFSKS